MKLFLASSFDKTIKIFEKKLGTSISGKKVIFVANAADKHTTDTWWVRVDREAFVKHGCNLSEIDLRNISESDLEKLLNVSDIIHFCGGSVLYLLNLIKEKGLSNIIIDQVRKGKIIYSGTSAGSIIPALDLRLFNFDSEEKEYIDVESIKDFSGLGLVNFLILPHTNNIDFVDANTVVVRHLPEFSQPALFLYDNQAVWVEGDKFEIVESN